MKQFIETLRVPVISTAHIPTAETIPNGDYLEAPYEGGWFFWIDEDDCDDWVLPIRAWLNANGFDGEYWVRFDSCGDIVEGLPVYEWEEA